VTASFSHKVKPSSASRLSAYIHEIDGVRGIALTLVVVFHIFGNGRVSGGVDVFLVISAYLLTKKLWGHFSAGDKSIGLGEEVGWLNTHFKRVVSRLVPSALLVISSVLVATYIIGSETQHSQVTSEAIASLLYFENWELIHSQLVYEAAGPESSPFQNFWSLSIQGQFFLFWPLFFLVLFLLSFRCRKLQKRFVVTSIFVLTVVSFFYAQHLVYVDQQVAYFNTFARFWELGIGALVFFMPKNVLNGKLAREVSIWIGLTTIVLSGFLFDGATLFPGIQTLWPVMGTILVIFGATRQAEPGLSANVLNNKFVKFLTKISYELFLWHWPVLVFYLIAMKSEVVTVIGGIVIVIISLSLAIISEKLFRFFKVAQKIPKSNFKFWARVLGPLSILLLLSLLWNYSATSSQAAKIQELGQMEGGDFIGSKALTDPNQNDNSSSQSYIPSLSAVGKDKPEIYGKGCVQSFKDEPIYGEVLVCDVDNYGSNKTVVLTGGSRSVHWYPALQNIAEKYGWRLLVIEKNGCRLSDSSRGSCKDWNDSAIDVISSFNPDAVFTLGTVVNSGESVPPGMIAQLATLESKGIQVFGFRGTPYFTDFKVPECLEDSDNNFSECSRLREDLFLPIELIEKEFSKLSSFKLLDLTDFICGPEVCQPVVGNILVYRDHSHMTATYVETLTEPLISKLESLGFVNSR
jgi:peptidoglycan/LPS O-acetylase OafA/YrhL